MGHLHSGNTLILVNVFTRCHVTEVLVKQKISKDADSFSSVVISILHSWGGGGGVTIYVLHSMDVPLRAE